MKHWRVGLLLFGAALAGGLAGCGRSGPDVFAEAEALEAQGKLEEAAAKFELTCAYAPRGDRCGGADGRAAEARLKAADKAMGEGDFARAARLLARAVSAADDATAKKATDRLASDDLIQGLAWQRALGRRDRRDIAVVMEGIAGTRTPAAALARAWLDKERPGLILAGVKAACGPKHEGSCSQAAAALAAAALTGPEAEEATALVEEEERRIYADRVKAEALLRTAGMTANVEEASSFCHNVISVIGIDAVVRCGQTNVPEPDEDDERNRKRIASETAWRRTLKSIGDPALAAALEKRRTAAIQECRTYGGYGEIGCVVERLDIPKPKPAPKKK